MKIQPSEAERHVLTITVDNEAALSKSPVVDFNAPAPAPAPAQ